MYELLLELAAEIGPTVAYAIGAVLMTAGGLLTERASLHELAAGDGTLAIWLGFMGLVMLYGGLYLMGYQGVVKRLRTA